MSSYFSIQNFANFYRLLLPRKKELVPLIELINILCGFKEKAYNYQSIERILLKVFSHYKGLLNTFSNEINIIINEIKKKRKDRIS